MRPRLADAAAMIGRPAPADCRGFAMNSMSRLVAGSVLVVVLATASAQAQERRPLSVVDAM